METAIFAATIVIVWIVSDKMRHDAINNKNAKEENARIIKAIEDLNNDIKSSMEDLKNDIKSSMEDLKNDIKFSKE